VVGAAEIITAVVGAVVAAIAADAAIAASNTFTADAINRTQSSASKVQASGKRPAWSKHVYFKEDF
jgi:dsRNA-specific ribonuclease